MSDVQSSATQVSDTAHAVAVALDASPINNEAVGDLVNATADAATLAAGAATSNIPVIATSSVKVLTDLVKLGPEVLELFKEMGDSISAIFHKKKS
jgi:hypothetical protein